MRITNNMITSNTKNNINSNKGYVDKYNTQMTTQKKITRASEDPVVAIRSLRLGTNLSHINQWVDNNIPDAYAWLDVTETALTNMKTLLTDVRTQCVNGSTDTLTEEDRNTILKSLTALRDQVYTEGNADYAGRTVFTGYRTSSDLTFTADDPEATYSITQKFDYTAIEEHRYYSGTVEVPTDAGSECTTEIGVSYYDRVRLAYGGIEPLGGPGEGFGGVFHYQPDDRAATTFTTFESEEAWEQARGGMKTVGDNEILFLQDSGEFVLGRNISECIKTGHGSIDVTYTKQGFEPGEVRPEYYYDCTDITDPNNPVEYTKENQDINFAVANNTYLTVNTQASDVFDTSIARDVDEMIDVVQKAVDAHDKVARIKEMMTLAQYSGEEDQGNLQSYLDAAEKEMAYADDNLQKTYAQYITNFDNYLQDVNIAITNIGSMEDRLQLTQTRVENQQMTVEELKSQNEDRDISDIIIDFYAAYNAYTSSLTAAGQVGRTTLLDYL